MRLNEFMEQRKSSREYKNKKLSKKEISLVEEILDDVNKEAKKYGVEYRLFNGKDIFDGLKGEGGYSGVMIEAPAYITLGMSDLNDKAYIYGSYYLEDIIGKLSNLGFGTCWVSLFSVDNKIKENVFKLNETIDFILAFGKPITQSILTDEPYSNRLSMEEFVYFNDFNTPATVEKLEGYGLDEIFYYLRNAPSAFNKQPWRFLIKDGKIDLFIDDFQGNVNLTDAGIVMYYYEELAALAGINASWDLEVEPCIETDKKFIGRTNF
ncbi:MAG: nitroreductase family protein [Miniphocaeibacter sp.]|uniref:nitroreductase family protein n=1 Tax=Miniphocaeibacter sp. TaxID=3100973 RepID=UPI00178E565D|nr:nitroreductase [Gallicola sp.]